MRNERRLLTRDIQGFALNAASGKKSEILSMDAINALYYKLEIQICLGTLGNEGNAKFNCNL